MKSKIKTKKYDYDIVLISPPSRMINHYRPPLALMYVGGYLQHKGLKVKIIDIPMKQIVRDKKFYENIDKELKKIEKQMISEFSHFKTKTVGITFYTPEYFEVFSLAEKFKQIDPDVKVIVGGIHPTFYPEEILTEKKSPIDFAVIGEGEITAYELVKAIINNDENFKDISGIAYFDKKNKKIVITSHRSLCENLDEISYPAYNLVDMDYYSNANPYAIRGCFLRSTYIMATRGCPSQCTFCVAKSLRSFNGGGKYTRVRSAKSLLEEIKFLKNEYKIDSFYFIDDLFTLNKENVLEFCRGIKKQGLNLLWGCSSKVSTLDEKIIKNMAFAGCIQMDFGVERGSNEALNLIKKGITVEMVEKIFFLCHKYKIRTFANFLVNLPKETEKDLADIIKLIKMLNSEIVSLNIFTPYPGTEIYQNHSYKFDKKEYPMLSNASSLVDKYPKKLKFADHDISLIDWAGKYSKIYNRIGNNLKFYVNIRYWKLLLKSPKKLNYLSQTGLLIREFINQKF